MPTVEHESNCQFYQLVHVCINAFRVGVIEWMENTKPLKDFLMDRLTQDERKRFDDAAKYNYEWLTKYGSDNMRRYKTMYKYVSLFLLQLLY